jgi:hypothetical protein
MIDEDRTYWLLRQGRGEELFSVKIRKVNELWQIREVVALHPEWHLDEDKTLILPKSYAPYIEKTVFMLVGRTDPQEYAVGNMKVGFFKHVGVEIQQNDNEVELPEFLNAPWRKAKLGDFLKMRSKGKGRVSLVNTTTSVSPEDEEKDDDCTSCQETINAA